MYHFNPTRVRLKRDGSALPGRSDPHFNPTRVRLKPVYVDVTGIDDILQPHKGASETGRSTCSASTSLILQPHKGASETAKFLLASSFDYTLQPHKGASETAATGLVYADFSRLQPHKGASETPRTRPLRTPPKPLQPHKGASETRQASGHSVAGSDFNPTRVRLKRSGSRSVRHTPQRTSTPQGCV